METRISCIELYTLKKSGSAETSMPLSIARASSRYGLRHPYSSLTPVARTDRVSPPTKRTKPAPTNLPKPLQEAMAFLNQKG
jgi:hypothetical protein